MARRIMPQSADLPPQSSDEVSLPEDDEVNESFTPGAVPVSRPPNPTVMKLDPMAEMFGPGSTTKFLGNEEEEIPDEIRGLIEENGLSKRDFSCTLKEIPSGSTGEGTDSSANSIYVKAWKRSIPSIEYIAREYGPGTYILVLTWKAREPDENQTRTRREVVPLTVSDRCAAEYRKHQLDKKITEASATGTKVREALVEKTIEGQLINAITGEKEDVKKPATPKEYIAEIMDTVRMLGLPVGGFGGQAVAAPKIEWDKILPSVIAGATALLGVLQQSSQRRVEESNKLFMMMLSQNQNASSQMLELVKSQNTSNNNPLQEMQKMIMNAMDIKQLMNPPVETVSDKIFKIVETVAPQILDIASRAAQNNQQPKGFAVDMAKSYVQNDPDFAKVHNDPAEMAKFVTKLDMRLGWKNADVVLGTVGWERPANCPRMPEYENPPVESDDTEDSVIED